MDLNLARSRGLAPLDADLHDAVGIFRMHSLRVHVFGQADHPPEFAAEALLTVVFRLLPDLDLALARHREQILLDGDVEALGIEARGEELDVHPLRRLTDVDRRKAAPRR